MSSPENKDTKGHSGTPTFYFIVTILQTVVLPIVFGWSELSSNGGEPILVFGKWWVFWGVGTRLLAAGIFQVFGGGMTLKILGADKPTEQERQLARELGTANIGMGLAGLLALQAGWIVPAGLAGGVFLLLAGLMHVAKKGKNAQETVATWTDLVVGVVVVIVALYVLIPIWFG
ncbi:MAG: DUF6790 family protein [Candidatus Nanopelagicales bacterium]